MRLDILSWLAGLLGFALMLVGVWMVYQPAAFMVAGAGLLGWAWLADKASAQQAARGGG